jgi:hypothetical protein
MSLSFHFPTTKLIDISYLSHWLHRRRNGNVVDEPRGRDGWYFYAPQLSVRGVELWEEAGGYELRLMFMASPGDYDLAGDLAVFMKELYSVLPVTEDGEALPSPTLLKRADMGERLRSESSVLRRLAAEKEQVELPGPKYMAVVNNGFLRTVDQYRAEHACSYEHALVARLLHLQWGCGDPRLKPIKTPDDWYQLLVDQSKTDHIYDLIHGYLEPGWLPNHKLALCVTRLSRLPDALSPPAAWHWSASLAPARYCFPEDDYMLLSNDYLGAYLEAARSLQYVTDDKGREFIELLYEPLSKPKKPRLEDEKDIPGMEDDPLVQCYERIHKGEDREEALVLAERGYEKIQQELAGLQALPGSTQSAMAAHAGFDVVAGEKIRLAAGFNIAAIAFAWNGKYNRAADADKHYIHKPEVWDRLEEHIGIYLEMLMAKQQSDYLEWLFGDMAFRKRFMAHYEACVSLLIDPHYELTTGMAIVPIVNRVNNRFAAYR